MHPLHAAEPAEGALCLHLVCPIVCPSRCLSRGNISSPAGQAALAVSQQPQASHDGYRPACCPWGQIHSCANMHSPTGSRVHSCAKWNSPQSRQVHFTDAAAGASNDHGWSSFLYFAVKFAEQHDQGYQQHVDCRADHLRDHHNDLRRSGIPGYSKQPIPLWLWICFNKFLLDPYYIVLFLSCKFIEFLNFKIYKLQAITFTLRGS